MNYKGTSIAGQRIDLVIVSCVLVELKATVTLHVIQEVKVISYLRTTGLRLGLLLNFHEPNATARIEKNSLLTFSALSLRVLRALCGEFVFLALRSIFWRPAT